jgi:transcriptional regulator of arginine metabolism
MLFLSAEGSENLVVIRTMSGGAAGVAISIDWEDWPEILGTVAGEDTIIVALRDKSDMPLIRDRLIEIARGGSA